MNAKAHEIGCTNSNFTNPSGIHDEALYSTAEDLSKIARYCMKNSDFRKIVSMNSCTIPATNKSGPRYYKNTNKLLQNDEYNYSSCIGIKTGFTSHAGNCLISASKKDNIELISVVLGGNNTLDGKDVRYVDSINLFEYGYENYSLKLITNSIYYETSLGKILNNFFETKSHFEENTKNKKNKSVNNFLLFNLFNKFSIFV